MPAEVVGVNDVLKGLSFIDEDMYTRIKVAIKPAMLAVETKAKGFVPSNSEVLSGWTKPISSTVDYRPFPKYDAANVKGGIGFKEGSSRIFANGFQVESYVYNISAAGRIYETAGRLNPEGRAPVMSTALREFGSVQGYSGSKGGRKRSTKDYNSNNPFAGYQFVSPLEKVTSQPKMKGIRSGGRKTKGRLIYKAWAQESPRVYYLIVKAINATAIDFNKATEVKKAA
jgi:hypothetical protein